jgi:hypothetical protein
MEIHSEDRPQGHHFTSGIIRAGIQLVLFANNSFRAAARSFQVFEELFHNPTPSFWSLRNWVLRLGLFELNKPKDRSEDWVFILDHTIAIGVHKAFVVLGIRLKELQGKEGALSHQDMTVLGVEVQERCNGQIVDEKLEEISQKVGIPRLLISDGGSDIKKGVGLFTERHPQTDWNYDISHRLAKLLESELKADVQWESFLKQTASTRSLCQQSALSYLMPPAQRTKARWMNLKPLIDWALKVIQNFQVGSSEEEKFNELFGWLYEYEESLCDYWLMIRMSQEVCRIVKEKGIDAEQVERCRQCLEESGGSERLERFAQDILKIVLEMQSHVAAGETLPGSSDIIESLFGKYKSMVSRSPLKAMSKLVLAVAALTSKRTSGEIKEAMETVSMKSVEEWFKAYVPESMWAKRKEALG